MSKQVNPYRHLLVQMRALFATERDMGPIDRAAFSWMIRADYLGTHCTVIKGGSNTCIVQLGDVRLDPAYPAEAIETISRLAAQPHPLYVVVRGDRQRRYPDLRDALAVTPRAGMKIGGLRPTDVEGVSARTLTHVAMHDVSRRMRWIPRARA